MAEWTIEFLAPTHDRSEFRCGRRGFDEFLRSLASQYEQRGVGRTLVLVRPGSQRVYGFYTLAAGSIQVAGETKSKRTKRLRSIPVVHLDRLAIDLQIQGQGHSARLMEDALKRCRSLAPRIGTVAVSAATDDERSKLYYLKFGFVPFHDDAKRLFLPLTSIGRA